MFKFDDTFVVCRQNRKISIQMPKANTGLIYDRQDIYHHNMFSILYLKCCAFMMLNC